MYSYLISLCERVIRELDEWQTLLLPSLTIDSEIGRNTLCGLAPLRLYYIITRIRVSRTGSPSTAGSRSSDELLPPSWNNDDGGGGFPLARDSRTSYTSYDR